MQEILKLLPVLGIAVLMNIGAGLYYNIGTKDISFDLKFLVAGIIKAGIVGGIFIGMAYCFDVVDLSSIGVTPTFTMMSAITLYTSKAAISLAKILGVEINKKEE